MRIATLTTLTLLACGLAFAGHAENAVYTGGNLDGIAPQANVVLDLSGDKAIKIHAGRTDFSVPYAGVSKTDVSAAPEAAKDPTAPKGKKGSSKSSQPAQILTLEYTNAQGEAKTMRLQLARPAATSVVVAIHKHSPVVQTAVKQKPAKIEKAKADKPKTEKKEVAQKDKDKPQKTAKKSRKDKPAEAQEVAKNDAAAKDAAKKDAGWWGDTYWKTTRNQAKWEQQSSSAAQ